MKATAVRSLVLVGVLIACGGGVKGTYSNAIGLAMLELGSGNKATLSLMGDAKKCPYAVEDKTITVTCGGSKSVFRLNGDG